MRRSLNVIGAVLALIGVVWILQGTNVLPGSFMTGQMKWAYFGIVSLVAGCIMLVAAERLGRKRGT